jgi:hypothetical protein
MNDRYADLMDRYDKACSAYFAARRGGLSDAQIAALRAVPGDLLDQLLAEWIQHRIGIAYVEVIRCDYCSATGGPVIFVTRGPPDHRGLSALCHHQEGARYLVEGYERAIAGGRGRAA